MYDEHFLNLDEYFCIWWTKFEFNNLFLIWWKENWTRWTFFEFLMPWTSWNIHLLACSEQPPCHGQCNRHHPASMTNVAGQHLSMPLVAEMTQFKALYARRNDRNLNAVLIADEQFYQATYSSSGRGRRGEGDGDCRAKVSPSSHHCSITRAPFDTRAIAHPLPGPYRC